MRRRLALLVTALAVVAALAGCGVSGITNTGVVGFGSMPQPPSVTDTPVPRGETEYDVYFQIGDFLKALPRDAKSGLPADVLYRWLLAQIAQGPTQAEIAQGFSPPDDAVSGVEMIQFNPQSSAAAIEINTTLQGLDLGQIICTLRGLNTQVLPINDSFGVTTPDDPTINWDDCASFQPAGGGISETISPSQ
jgi:hypothetical protein